VTTRAQFRATVRQVLAQGVTPWEILAEACAEYAAHVADEANADDDSDAGLTPESGETSGNW